MRASDATFDSTDTVSTISSDGRGSAFVTIPDAHFLFHAEFKRTGSDLTLTGEDGHRVLVPDYFKHERLPTLLSPDGEALSGNTVAALAGSLAPAQYAQAGQAPAAAPSMIGRVDSANGAATVLRGGASIQLNAGDNLRQGDVIQTGSSSSVTVMMIDGTALNLSANTRMVLNEYIFDPSSTNNSSLLTLVQGGFASVAGQIAKTGGLNIQTKVATMGIRGTEFAASCESGCTFAAAPGSTYQLFYEGNPIATVTFASSPTLTAIGNNQPPQIVFAPTAPPQLQLQITELVQIYPQIFVQPPPAPTPPSQSDPQSNPKPGNGSSTTPLLQNDNPVNPQPLASTPPPTKTVVTLPASDSAPPVTVTVTFQPPPPPPPVDQPPVDQPPAVSNPIANQTSDEDHAWTFVIPANAFSDPDSPTLTLAATLSDGSPLPNWLSFDPATRTFSGTPPADANGEVPLRVTVSDGTSSVANIFILNISPVNDAPVVVNGEHVALSAIQEDTANPSGATLSSLLASHFSDAADNQVANGGSAANVLAGFAIYANPTNPAGAWQWSTDGTQWNAIPTDLGDNHALVLAASALIRFVPSEDFNGEAPQLIGRLIDNSAGAVTNGSFVDLTAGVGGTTPYSSAPITIGETINPVNDAPPYWFRRWSVKSYKTLPCSRSRPLIYCWRLVLLTSMAIH